MENNNLLFAPVKRKVSNGFHATPAKITEMNDMFNKKMDEATEKDGVTSAILAQPTQTNKPKFKTCTRRLQRGNRKGEQCLRAAHKYGMCPYHLGVWKRNNPFLKHP